MTETQAIWLVLAVVYGFECVFWLRRGSVGFRTWFGERWAVVLPAQLAGNQTGGFAVAHPLPPFGTVLVASPIPFALAPEGILIGRAVVRWPDIKGVAAANKSITINGTAVMKAASNAHAVELAAELKRLAVLSPAARVGAIAALVERSLDVDALRTRWEQFRAATASLRWLCNGLLVLVFGIAPVVVHRVGFERCWWALLAALFALTIPIAVLSRRHHRRLYPGAEDDRFALFLTCLLSPASAVRALDALSRPLLAMFHPLAAARVFCGENELRRMSAVTLRELRFAPEVAEPSVAAEIERHFRRETLATIERWLHRLKIDPAELLRAPQPSDSNCAAYCPRCLAQFTSTGNRCGDCGGVELKPFKPAA